MQRLWKTIGEIILATVGAFLSVCCLLLLILAFTAPGAVAVLTYNMGMYGQSAWLASMQYADGKGDVSYIADAMRYSIEQKNYEMVVEYGNQLVADARFADYCAEIQNGEGETFDQFVYGQISISYYRLSKNDEAVETAFSAIGESFPHSNAVADLVYVVVINQDKDMAKAILTQLVELRDSSRIKDDSSLTQLVVSLKNFTDQE